MDTTKVMMKLLLILIVGTHSYCMAITQMHADSCDPTVQVENFPFKAVDFEPTVGYLAEKIRELPYETQIEYLREHLRNGLKAIDKHYEVEISWIELQTAYQMFKYDAEHSMSHDSFSHYYWGFLDDIFADEGALGISRMTLKGINIPHDWYWALVESTIAVPIYFVPGGSFVARTLWGDAIKNFFKGCKELGERTTKSVEQRIEEGCYRNDPLYRISPC